jgi:NSS family neurotransmitter:Na+ symporter
MVRAARGDFAGGMDVAQSQQVFGELIGGSLEPVVLTAIFLGLTAIVVRGGVGGGIERASKILMPLFFVILLVLAIRAITLPGAQAGIEFLYRFDASKLTGSAALSALGQALFSLSLGMGAMITYGSYLAKKENLATAGIAVATFDTLIAMLAGLIIFPAMFAAGAEPSGGPGLVFIAMPTIFHQLPAGLLFSVAFYALLAIAALTSTISLLEVVVAYFVDERGWTREKSVWTITGATFVLAIPSALSQGAVRALSAIPVSSSGLFHSIFGGAKTTFLDIQAKLFGDLSLAVGAFFIAIFVGWIWGTSNAVTELREVRRLWLWTVPIRYLCPAAVLAIFVYFVFGGAL